MREIEVRCCCDAHLIGWLPMCHAPQEGRRYVFVLSNQPRWSYRKGEFPTLRHIESLTFECARIEGPGVNHLALKSRDYQLEQLRRIDGFREATGIQRIIDRRRPFDELLAEFENR
jgi:hypothetical protein